MVKVNKKDPTLIFIVNFEHIFILLQYFYRWLKIFFLGYAVFAKVAQAALT